MSSSFPHTILFSWLPPEGRNVAEEMIDVTSRLKAHTVHPSKNWEVSVIMKMQKSNSSFRPGMQPIASEPIPPVYFFRYPDCNAICSLISNKDNVYTAAQIVSGDENLEKILTDYSHLIRRSLWKVCGQSYLLDKYVISIGKMGQGSTSRSLILEVSYVGDVLQNNEVIYESIYAVAKSLFPSIPNNGEAVLSFLEHTPRVVGDDSTTTPEFSIANRCLQWMACLKHNT
jgi:hypothetical protein